MRLHVFRYGDAVTFPTELPLERAVSRLREAAGRPAIRLRNTPGVVGTVAEHKVRLQRLRGFDGNAFKPFFVGRFVVEGKTELRGAFTMPWLSRLVMSVWFAVSALATLFAFYVVSVRRELSLVPLIGVGFFLFGAALLAAGKRLCRDDPAYLTRFIASALVNDAAVPSSEPPRRPATAAAPRGLVNNEPVDRLVAEIASTIDDSRLDALFSALDSRADAVRWFVDKDYAAVALVDAALAAASANRREKMLGHAIYRARGYASFATSGGEGMARMNEVERIEALLRGGA